MHSVGAQHRKVVLQCLVLGGQVLWKGGSRAGEVVGGRKSRSRGGRHSVAWAMRGQRGVVGEHGVGNDVIALRRRLRRGRGVTVRVGTR